MRKDVRRSPDSPEALLHRAIEDTAAAEKACVRALKNVEKASASLRDRGTEKQVSDHSPGNEEPQAGMPGEWITITEAAGLAEVYRGVISRKADSGEIRDNSRKGRKRRVEKASVHRWMDSREEKRRRKASTKYNRGRDGTSYQF